MFLRDDTMVYSGQSIGNVRLALTGSPLAAELVDLGYEIDAVMCSYKARNRNSAFGATAPTAAIKGTEKGNRGDAEPESWQK